MTVKDFQTKIDSMRLKVDTPKTVNLKIFSENRLTKNIFLEPLEL